MYVRIVYTCMCVYIYIYIERERVSCSMCITNIRMYNYIYIYILLPGAQRFATRGCMCERLAEYGWNPHRDFLARTNRSQSSIYWYVREQHRGTVSLNSKCQRVLSQEYSANLSMCSTLLATSLPTHRPGMTNRQRS